MQHIERNYFSDQPVIVDYEINEGCILSNMILGMANFIVDKDFLNDMKEIINTLTNNNYLLDSLLEINVAINNYFYKSPEKDNDRAAAYINNSVPNDEGLILGTALSSLKGKNVAMCSEKSMAAYIIMKKRFDSGQMTRKPSLVLSYMGVENDEIEPHAFVMLNKENDGITSHILFDPENPSLIENEEQQQHNWPGIYCLTEEEYQDFLDGGRCSPKSIYEILSDKYQEIGKKRTYGSLSRSR